MTVRKSIDIDTPLTDEQLEILRKTEALPIVYDEDSPELTDAELDEFKRIADLKRENRKKQTVTLRLSPQTLSKARALGKGYTSVLSRILDLAMDDKELIKKCL